MAFVSYPPNENKKERGIGKKKPPPEKVKTFISREVRTLVLYLVSWLILISNLLLLVKLKVYTVTLWDFLFFWFDRDLLLSSQARIWSDSGSLFSPGKALYKCQPFFLDPYIAR